MEIQAAQIKSLREATGAGVLDCRKTLVETGGDFDKAILILREKGLAAAAKRADRTAKDGVVEIYNHGNGRVGVMVEVNCETDFVARTPEFRQFAHELALQIAAAAPRYLDVADIPAAVVEEQKASARALAETEGKAANVIDRIIEGRLAKFHQETCLLRQTYIRDDAITVGDLLKQTVASTKENVVIRRFIRWELGAESG
jgi:elongation factor Ts